MTATSINETKKNKTITTKLMTPFFDILISQVEIIFCV